MTTISTDGALNNIYLRMSGSDMQYFVGSTPKSPFWNTISAWPVTINNSNPSSTSILDVIVTTDLTISTSTGGTNGYFIIDSPYITFNGSGYTITINSVTGYLGFIQNGTSSANGQANVVVNNFTTAISGASTLANAAGWLCQSYFGKGISGIVINNCTNNGPVNAEAAGGIAGTYAGAFSGNVSFTSCMNLSTGLITGIYAGGIVGSLAGQSGILEFTNCINNGDISGINAGGIAGYQSGSQSGTNTFTDCVNTGNISGENAGGIAGRHTGYLNGLVTFSGCSNTGSISGDNTGGIVGYAVGISNGTIIIENCANSGNISGPNAGGIVANNAGNTDGKVTLTNCFNTGLITGLFAGGIAGSRFAFNTSNICSISNSYSTGDIISGVGVNNKSGGIVGSNVGYNLNNINSYTPVVDISNCYSLGAIAATCGGICGGDDSNGSYANNPVITITNCYSWGAVTDPGSGIVAISLQIPITQNNIYVANGTWSDASANANLTGTPTDISTNNPGPTWTTIETNNITPYVLSLYNAQIYNPNSASSSSSNYTTSAGGFVDPSYNYQIVYNNQVSNVAITRVFVAKGSTPYYYSYNSNTFQFTNTGTPSDDIINASILDPLNGQITYSMSPVCFKEGTKILCENEMYIPIEELKIGNLVKTYKHGYQKVIMTAHTNLLDYSQNTRNQLYTYSREKNPDLIEDLHLTGGHSLLVDALTEEESTHMQPINWAKEDFMVDDKYKLLSWYNEKLFVSVEQNVEIYHFTLEPPENAKPNYVYGIYANGILAESCSKGAMEQVCKKK